MESKYTKFIYFIFCFLAFIFLYIASLTNKALALEVAYPIVSGQALTNSSDLPGYVKYLFNVGMFVGFFAVFLSLTIAGVMYFLSPIKNDLLSEAKDRIYGSISGLLILVLVYLIITTINPQLSFLNLGRLRPTPPAPPTPKSAGVSFYKNSADCPNNDAQLSTTSSVSDLMDLLRNQVNAVGIRQDTNTQTYYISILYQNINLWGRCLYLDPNQTCQSADDPKTGSPFASSASVYSYNFNPNGDGVYLYHGSCFNNQPYSNINDLISYCNSTSSGYLKINNSNINGIYVKNLNDLSFTGNGGDCTVPYSQQDCIQYDKNGACTQKKCPTLAGENLSSIIINGDYLVLLVYFDPTDDPYGIWSSCQEFPTDADVNKIGPRQIKWENIRNNGKQIPNYIIAIPIQRRQIR